MEEIMQNAIVNERIEKMMKFGKVGMVLETDHFSVSEYSLFFSGQKVTNYFVDNLWISGKGYLIGYPKVTSVKLMQVVDIVIEYCEGYPVFGKGYLVAAHCVRTYISYFFKNT